MISIAVTAKRPISTTCNQGYLSRWGIFPCDALQFLIGPLKILHMVSCHLILCCLFSTRHVLPKFYHGNASNSRKLPENSRRFFRPLQTIVERTTPICFGPQLDPYPDAKFNKLLRTKDEGCVFKARINGAVLSLQVLCTYPES